MSVFKCKMCGGTIEFEQGATVGVCDSCGTKQTLPRLDDDRKANLYDRANHFRRNNEFDKAMGIYEQILSEDNTDAEAYWSLVLCRYGIEYVEDPTTRRRVPTVNRAQFTSVFDDDNYRSALHYADPAQREVYEAEATAINEIQKGILAISQKEEPFDVFICYKETDKDGQRTPDSVLANDLYHQLTQEGFKVFFSRITLEDKLGSAYEPYIFAALNSAKVMVVLGTKPEYFNAVWVKNEWSRYLALVKNSNGQKMLIPAYKDMDPYDLPEEFSHLQAQDMSKLGFMQDLIRGIKKILSNEKRSIPTQANTVPKSNVKNLLVLAQTALDMENEDEALSYLNKALENDSSCSEAWVLKMELVAHQIKRDSYQEYRLKELSLCEHKALEYAAESTKEDLSKRLNEVYSGAFQGYANSILKTLKSNSSAFDIEWRSSNNNKYIQSVNCLKDATVTALGMSKVLPAGEDTLLTMQRLYNALHIRMDIADQQAERLRQDMRYEVRSLVAETRINLSEMKRNLETAFPAENWEVKHIVLPEALGKKPDTSSDERGLIIGGIILLIVGIPGLSMGIKYFNTVPGPTFLMIILSLAALVAGIALIVGAFKSRKDSIIALEKYTENAKKVEEFNRRLEI